MLLLVGPSTLFLLAVLLNAIVNFVVGSSQPSGTDQLFPQPTPFSTVASVVTFIMAAMSIVTWIPGLIIGIIFLKKK